MSEIPPLRILYVEDDPDANLEFIKTFGHQLNIKPLDTTDEVYQALQDYYPADAVIASRQSGGMELLRRIRAVSWLKSLPFILTVDDLTPDVLREAKDAGASDVFPRNFRQGDIVVRLRYFLRKQQLKALQPTETPRFQVRIPWWKRALDIATTGTALLILSPLLLAVALLIRLDSKGPIIYRSRRVGSGYRVFSLLKFRTMRTDADKMVKDMAAFNMYNRDEEAAVVQSTFALCSECQGTGHCQKMLYLDNEHLCEKIYLQRKHNKAAFMKFGNDPRITRIGGFLRNTSIDELPQLINILRGDMSLVGNRPLPLYEAEKLTSDESIARFAGPAGLTGLWQVTKRGKGKKDMSEEERLQLDIEYARNFSFGMDLKIILKTFPALFQSENV